MVSIQQQMESKSPGSMSSKGAFSLSRQGTLRSSHRRKNSLSASSAAVSGSGAGGMPTGRRSPVMLSPRSPAAGEMPGGFGNGGGRSPTTLFAERRSNQSFSSQGRRSPVSGGFYEPMQTMMMERRSPTSTVHVQDRRSPVAFLDDIEEGRRSPSHHFATTGSSTGIDTAGEYNFTFHLYDKH